MTTRYQEFEGYYISYNSDVGSGTLEKCRDYFDQHSADRSGWTVGYTREE